MLDSAGRTNLWRARSFIEHRRRIFEMADEQNTNQNKGKAAAAGAAFTGGTARQGDVKTERGGEQTDQISGETQKGAHNQEMENRNPQGNKNDNDPRFRKGGDTWDKMQDE
jgi:hypothetical protein